MLGIVKADSHMACCAHAVPLPCRATKGLECVFPIWFTQCGHVWFALAVPRPCHPFFSRPRHSTAVERLLAREVIRRIPISDAGSQCETKHRLHGWGKSGGSTLQKKTICYNVGLAVRIFPATMRTFTKDTAHSEQGRGAAWHVWGMAGERHGSNMGAVCYVWIGLNTSIVIVKLYLYSFIKGNKIFRNIGEHFPKNQSLIYQKTEYSTTFYTYLTKKMDQTECSETSAHKIQTPGNYPDESAQLSAKTLY